MIGAGIRSAFTVTDSGDESTPPAPTPRQVDAANAHYQAYVKDQSTQLVAGTEAFAAAYKAGDDAGPRPVRRCARALGAHRARGRVVRRPGPGMDLREADLEEGQEWTGWHRHREGPVAAERTGLRRADAGRARRVRRPAGGRHRDPARRMQDLTFTVDQIGNGAKSCSTRSRPARSPARRRSGRTPTSRTSRPTSTAPRVPSRAAPGPARPRTRPREAHRPSVRRARRRCSIATARATGSCSYTELTSAQVKGSPTR